MSESTFPIVQDLQVIRSTAAKTIRAGRFLEEDKRDIETHSGLLLQTRSAMAPPEVGPDEMLAVAWFGKVWCRTPIPRSYGPCGLFMKYTRILQEKVEVIRAKKPHIIEPVRLLTKTLYVAQQAPRLVTCCMQSFSIRKIHVLHPVPLRAMSMFSKSVVIRNPAVQTDAILKVTSTCICGSDLHLYLGFVPGMEPGRTFCRT